MARTRYLLLLATLAAAFLCAAPARAAWSLVWSDEFDGTSLDTGNWNIDTGNGCPELCGWGNNELQYYRAENVAVTGGNLVLTAKAEPYAGFSFTSGKITSENKRTFRYGRMEMRAKLPVGGGMWPAFWMMPQDDVYGGWAASGELDIMESANGMTFIGGAIHYGGSWPGNTYSSGSYTPGGSFADAFHVYAVEWEPDAIRWYVDDVLFYTRTSAQWYSDGAPGNPRAPFDQDFFLLLNLAVGGNYTGCINTGCITASFPQQYLVDYVRVYENVALQEPYAGSPFEFPTLIQAEDYDLGGAGLAYSDADATNNGGQYRPSEGVDLEVCTDTGGGYNVGWVSPGEWIEYTVDVPLSGTYDLTVRVASQSVGGSFHLNFNGVDETGTVAVPVTGGWQAWTTVAFSASLDAGETIMRFTVDSGEFNVNWFEVSGTPTGVPDGATAGIISLHRASPNPFSPRTTIRYDLEAPARVTLAVYDIRGRRVTTLVAGETTAAGTHEVMWDGRTADGSRAPAGVYLTRLQAGEWTATTRMVLLH